MNTLAPRLTRRSAALGLLVGGLSLTDVSAVTTVTAAGFPRPEGDLAEDFVQHSPYAAPGGRDEPKEWWAGIVHAIPDHHVGHPDAWPAR